MWPSWCVLGPLWAVLPFIRAEVLTPPYFNIAGNRKVEASSTCGVGVEGPELYCKLVGASQDFRDSDNTLIDGQVCDVCDPKREDKYHPPSLAVDGTESYWLSPPLSRGEEYHKVNLTIDLGQEFHVAYVLIKMGISPRPGLWVLEKSTDNGETYTPWQYFAETAADCILHFGKESLQPITKDDSVICTTIYSKIVPLDHGEIVVSLLNDRPSANDFFNSSVLQEWTRATNVRLRLIRTQTLYGHLMSLERQDPTVTRRYFYSIKDISIGGRCRCNGHADVCVSRADHPYKLKCECQHKTCGDNCEKCCENKVQKKWRQSKANMLFECEECNCNGHTDLCVYNATVDELGLSMDIHGKFEGGGVCKHCRDNTQGINCEKCKPLFYKPWDKMINQTDACKPCNCTDRRYTGNCAEGSGICECKQNYAGPHCNVCSLGYTDYPNCTPCPCNLNGTLGSICDPVNGTCFCMPNFFGERCDECNAGFYNFPKCELCSCYNGFSVGVTCDPETGTCKCLPGVIGDKCDTCPYRWVFNKTTGCSKCDKCVHDLLDVVDKLPEQLAGNESKFVEIKNFAKQRLLSMNNTIEKVFNHKILDLKNYKVNVNTLNREFEELQGNVDDILKKFTSTMEKINGTMRETLHNANKALKDLERADNVKRKLLDVGETVKGYYGKKAEQDVKEATDILNKLKNFTNELTEDMEKAKNYDERSEKLLENITAHKMAIDNKEHDLIELNNKIKQLNDRLQDVRGHSQNTKKNVEQINEIHKNLRDELSGVTDINARILKENNDAEQLLQNTYGILKDTWSLLKQANASSYNLEGEKVKWDELTLEVGNKSNDLNDLEGVTDLVQQAVNSNALENKTEVLTSVAKQYQQDTNAVEQAYKNIVDTLRGAYITSEEAGNFSEKASNQTTGLGNRTLDSKQLSANLENEAQQVLNIINNVLKTEFLKEEEKFKSVLNLKDQTDKELQGIKNELGNITVAPIDHEILNRAQQNEEEAERLKNRIADIAKDFPLSKELAERLETAEQDSNRNVTEVKKIMAQMDNELKNINSLEENFRITSSNMEKTNQDIKDKLEKLKKKIEKARDSVNSIKVAVSFNHTSLDLRKPKNLEKQGINNYVSLYFKTTEPDGLLFYLGNEKVSKRRARRYVNSEDFMALEIQNGLLKLTVDLGNGPTSIIDDNNVIDGHWYQTIVERTAKTIRLTVRVPNTTLQPTVHVKEGVIKGTSTILNLNRETSKLFIGGFPSTFTPPEEITSKPYLGQMEELFIGGSLLSLWNFEEKSKPSAAKERNELINTTFTTGFRFNGYGYVIMAKNNLDNRFHRMSKASAVTLSFKTFSKDGLLFLSEKGTNFMSIEIREGRILYQFNLGEGLATMFSSETYNDGKWHRVETSRLENDGVLKVDGKFIKKDSALGTNNRMKVPAEFYVGGYPHRNILEVTNANFDGCIDEVSFDDPVDLNKYTAAEGVIAGCPDKVASVVSFEEGAKGYVLQPNISATNDSMELILRFNTAAKTGLLAYAVDDESSMALWLEDGQLIFTNGDDYIKSTLPNKYNDRKWHVVMAVYDSTTFQLFVDDIDTYSSKEPIKKPVRMVHGDLYFGGISSAVDAAAALKSQFSGCISDVTWNGDIINFGNLTEIPRAIVGKCVLLRPIPFPAGLSDEITEEPLGAADPEVAPLISNPKFTEDCKLPLYGTIPLMNENAGYRFGAAFGSRFEYVTLRVNLKNKYRFSIEIKTKANDGVIFFAFNNKNNNFIALYLKDGKINYGFDCGSGDALLFSDRVVNDNKWHTIEFRRQAENGHLRIDNFTVAKGSSRGNLRTLDVDKYFLGGLDPLMRQDPISVMKGINASFEGCLRNFKVNDRDIKNAQSIAVQPCVDTVEDGIYFSPDGGYIEQRTRFKVGVKFRVEFNIKPRSLSGLLLSIHGRKDYLVLELVNGTVRMTVENGDGEITSTYIPPDRSLLCDGHWHTIKAIKSKHVITLAVDNDFKDPVQGKRFPSVDTQHTLYLGGHPNPKRLPGVLSPFSYVGCLKNLVINGVIEPIYIRNTVGSVTINACPTN